MTKGGSIPELKKRFLDICKDREALKHGEFILNSGIKSDVFFDSGILSDAESFSLMCDLFVAILVESNLEFDAIIGLPYKGISIAATVCVKYFEKTGRRVSYGYHRKEKKDHGEQSMFVGNKNVFSAGTRLVIIDDVLTTGKALGKALELLEPLKVDIKGVLVILNREVTYGRVGASLLDRGIILQEALRLEELRKGVVD